MPIAIAATESPDARSTGETTVYDS